MKKLLGVGLIILAVILIGFTLIKNRVRRDLNQIVLAPTAPLAPTVAVDKSAKITSGLFIPYWTVNTDLFEVDIYDQLVYFGVAASSSGTLQDEPGLKKVTKFHGLIPQDKQTLLALRMIGTDTDLAILKDSAKQNSLITETVAAAKDNQFNGVVLDLELSALPFDTVVKQISDFVTNFSQTAKQNGLQFSMLMYGDTFYRLRPFDMKTIGSKVDGIMIMSYDFSKANGDPGPNFPLQGQDSYGYDMTKMVNDFTHVIPANKLTVVFGRFGYDWTVDDNGHGIETAQAITDQQIQNKFFPKCSLKDCLIFHDQMSAETRITYTDDTGKKHIVWFEEEDSIVKKQNYLKQQAITHFSNWAYSYF